ncbi:MAG: hypothetical protein ACOC2P_03330 [Spirochaetota bacterium]
MERKVSIKVNGKKVPINKFVHQITQNIIISIVEALHDTDADGTIEIRLEPRSAARQNGDSNSTE